MVEATLRMVDPNIPFTAVHAARGKVVRAEPAAALYDLGSRSLGRRLELPLFRQGVTKGGFGACVYAGAGSGAGSATEIIFFGVDMPRVFRISPRLSGIFVR